MSLVLRRKTGQSIVVLLPGGREVVVKLLEIRRGACRLAIDAPTEVPVHRQEVALRILKGNGEGAS